MYLTLPSHQINPDDLWEILDKSQLASSFSHSIREMSFFDHIAESQRLLERRIRDAASALGETAVKEKAELLKTENFYRDSLDYTIYLTVLSPQEARSIQKCLMDMKGNVARLMEERDMLRSKIDDAREALD